MSFKAEARQRDPDLRDGKREKTLNEGGREGERD